MVDDDYRRPRNRTVSVRCLKGDVTKELLLYDSTGRAVMVFILLYKYVAGMRGMEEHQSEEAV